MALDELVDRANALAPSVMVIERVHVLSDTELLSEYDGITKLIGTFVKFADSVPHNVFLILESSVELADLPMAAKRCSALQHALAINIPTATRREQIVKRTIGQLLFGESSNDASETKLDVDMLCQRVAAATPGYVARDIVRLCRHAFLRMLRSGSKCQYAESVDALAKAVAQMSLSRRSTIVHNGSAIELATALNWQWFGSALQIVRPSQQLEFESARPAKRWADIGGYEAVKQQLQRFVRLATSDVPSRLGITPPTGILLHGPSGCGKTAMALAMIGESA
ncbi:hypothetical protein GGI21_005174, partial [Coemansia aciculifera]